MKFFYDIPTLFPVYHSSLFRRARFANTRSRATQRRDGVTSASFIEALAFIHQHRGDRPPHKGTAYAFFALSRLQPALSQQKKQSNSRTKQKTLRPHHAGMKLPALTAAAAASSSSLALLLALTLQPVAVDALSVGDLLNPFVRPNQYMTYMTPPLSSPTPPTNFRRRGFSFASFWVFPRTLLLLLFIFLFFPRWPRASTHEYRSRSEMCARRHVSRSRI